MLAAAIALFLLLAEVDTTLSGWLVSVAVVLPVVAVLWCAFESDIRLVGAVGAFFVVVKLFLASVLFEPELLRLVGSCELDDSESELDELLSEPLELPLDDDDPELDPELDSVVLVDC